MRINKLIPRGKMLWPHIKISQFILLENAWGLVIHISCDQCVTRPPPPVSQWDSQAVSHSVSQSVSQSVNQPVKQSVSQSISQSVGQLVSHSVSKSVGHLVSQPVSQSLCNWAVSHSASHWVRQNCLKYHFVFNHFLNWFYIMWKIH